MEGMRFIQSIRLENILSFGPDMAELPLEPLNVLIGPNASGKSNLIEALSLLQAAPQDLQEPIRRGGGVRDWLWKGVPVAPTATVEVTIEYPSAVFEPRRYRLSFNADVLNQFAIVDEVVEDTKPGPDGEAPDFYYRYKGESARYESGRLFSGSHVIKAVVPTEGDPLGILTPSGASRFEQVLPWGEVEPGQSILSQRRDPLVYPELWVANRTFSRIRFYRELDLRRDAPVRLPQKPDLPQGFLMEDASNLSVVLSDLLNQPDVRERILERMRDFYPSFRDVMATVSGGAVQIFFHEKGLRHPVPATRLSDGSLRYLCLLAVLCNPNSPGVVCIEEPELGLHPDIIPEVAKLLVEASSRSQIFVTTHSDVLVDALTETPEAVIVCEKEEGATRMRRLDAEELKPWLEEYRLGEMWTRGEIGGNRW